MCVSLPLFSFQTTYYYIQDPNPIILTLTHEAVFCRLFYCVNYYILLLSLGTQHFCTFSFKAPVHFLSPWSIFLLSPDPRLNSSRSIYSSVEVLTNWFSSIGIPKHDNLRYSKYFKLLQNFFVEFSPHVSPRQRHDHRQINNLRCKTPISSFKVLFLSFEVFFNHVSQRKKIRRFLIAE